MVGRVEVVFSKVCQMGFDVIFGFDGKGKVEEFASLLLENSGALPRQSQVGVTFVWIFGGITHRACGYSWPENRKLTWG